MFNPTAVERLFPFVEKPGRYTGGEWNSLRKDPSGVRMKVVLAFPDVYEIGMSYLGQKILYDLINVRPEWQAERVFAPWPDMEEALRSSGQPLFSLESRTPLAAFDVLGFSLLYELNYSNVLTILDLAGLPLRAADRPDSAPLVIAGGPSVFNPEPMADFFDLFLVGDGEEAFPEILHHLGELKAKGARKREILRTLSDLEGVYVPSLYETRGVESSPLLAVRPLSEAPARVRKRVISAFAQAPFPTDIVVPNVRSVFDRVAIEVARGCPQKCRFCQATTLYAPFRIKNPSKVVETALRSVIRTGYEDASLFSLSVSDYPYLPETIRTLMSELERERVSLSLSALRPKGLSSEIAKEISKVRKTGFTLVPEAGTDRLRRVINKDLTDADILEASTNAFREGWRLLKLYVMIGLPTETEEDLDAIAVLCDRLTFLGREISGGAPQINLSVSSFIPKPHTPFQWAAMDDSATLFDKQSYLKGRLIKRRNVKVKTHPIESSLLEAVFSRGDRRLGGVLLRAWRNGARFDSWGDRFRFDYWRQAFEDEDLDPGIYLAALDPKSDLPWDHIDSGVTKDFLRREFERAFKAETTPSCLDESCGLCRGCDYFKDVEKKFSKRIETTPDPFPRLGTEGGEILCYDVSYIKEGPVRYIGHNDLINTIQRSFRRAGVQVAYSEGFHPKMRMSFIPPLALGMEGRDERLEFKTCFLLEPVEFLKAVNSCSPEGLRFIRLERSPGVTPSLSTRLRGLVYSVDLTTAEVREALDRLRQAGPGGGPLDDLAIVRKRIEEELLRPADLQRPGIEVDAIHHRLVLTYVFNPQKAPRPQEVVTGLLGLTHPAYVIVRDRVLLDSPGPTLS